MSYGRAEEKQQQLRQGVKELLVQAALWSCRLHVAAIACRGISAPAPAGPWQRRKP
jgi:hypothetical protein